MRTRSGRRTEAARAGSSYSSASKSGVASCAWPEMDAAYVRRESARMSHALVRGAISVAAAAKRGLASNWGQLVLVAAHSTSASSSGSYCSAVRCTSRERARSRAASVTPQRTALQSSITTCFGSSSQALGAAAAASSLKNSGWRARVRPTAQAMMQSSCGEKCETSGVAAQAIAWNRRSSERRDVANAHARLKRERALNSPMRPSASRASSPKSASACGCAPDPSLANAHASEARSTALNLESLPRASASTSVKMGPGCTPDLAKPHARLASSCGWNELACASAWSRTFSNSSSAGA
mmetsp:Transcript_43004/g.106072  ORF Transcript_43004/g.106072 Transcript_43004/m.106072 type:complete len:298 (-) Transcript_43004:525-1418(-)